MTCAPSMNESSLCSVRIAMDSNLLQTDDDDTDQTGCMPMADLSSLGTEAILLVSCA